MVLSWDRVAGADGYEVYREVLVTDEEGVAAQSWILWTTVGQQNGDKIRVTVDVLDKDGSRWAVKPLGVPTGIVETGWGSIKKLTG